MSGTPQNSKIIVAALAGALCFVLLVFLMEVFGLGTTPAFLIAVLLALAILVALYMRRQRSSADRSPASSGLPGAAGAVSGAVHSDAGSGRQVAADGAANDRARDGAPEKAPGRGPSVSEAPDESAAGDASTDRAAAPPSDAATDPVERADDPAAARDTDATGPTDAVSATDDAGTDHAEVVGTGVATDPGEADGDPSAGSGAAATEARPDADPAPGGDAPEETMPDGFRVRSGTLLAGEAELSARKGNWRYEKRPASEADARPDAAAAQADPGVSSEGGAPMSDMDPDDTAAGDPDPGPSADMAGPATDAGPLPAGDEVAADAGMIGTQPARLDSPREGGSDDLKRIKGVGPKLEDMLHRMGFYHYDQIAAWTDQEAAWVDENLEGFRGRVRRDDWVAQAHTLAEGGETDFSRRADDGDVY